MPSWKKVITSGSNAALNTLTVTNGITGSLFGTASFATQATSASFAINASSSLFAVSSSRAISASFATFAQSVLGTITNANTASNITPAITNAADNRILTANDGGTVNGEANLTFDGTNLEIFTGSLLFTSQSQNTINVQLSPGGGSGNIDHYLDVFTGGGRIVRMGNDPFDETENNTGLFVTGRVGLKASALGTAATQILVFNGDPASTIRNIFTRTPAQLRSDIGAQATLVNPVTGTGTTNFVPKFTSGFTKTLGNSLVFDNGTNVGIGTTAPTAKLDVSGSTRLDGNTTITGSLTVTNEITGSLFGTASFATQATSASFATTASFAVSSSFASTASFVTTLNQDVAIEKVGFGVSLSLTALSAGGTEIKLLPNSTAGFARINVGNANQPLDFQMNSANAMRITQAGDVGIGTTTPSAKLDVSGSTRLNGDTTITGSLGVTNGITGSLFGTASFASTSSFLNSTTNAFIQNGNSFGTTATLGTNDNQSLVLETSGSTRMFISSSGNVGIGTTVPTAKLNVKGNTIITGSLKIAGTLVTTQDIRINGIDIGRANSIANVLVGDSALFNNTTGNSNVAIGSHALFTGSNFSGLVAIGTNALRLNTIGSANTAVGTNTLKSNTTGNNNTAIGHESLISCSLGFNNTANGKNTLSKNNGNNNSAFGKDALLNNVVGSGNVAIGSTSLTNTTGNNNVAIGFNTNTLNNVDNNSIVIGHSAAGIGSNTVVLGNSSIVTTVLRGDVGIGTTSPDSKLAVGLRGSTDGNTRLSAAGTGVDAGASLLWDMDVGGGNPISHIAEIRPESFATGLDKNVLNFYVGAFNNNANSGPAKMVISENGEVGIGGGFESNNALVATHNDNTFASTAILNNINTGSFALCQLQFRTANNSSNPFIIHQFNDGGAVELKNDANASLSLATSGSTRLTITNDGAMGLGITPTNTLGRFEASNDIVAFSSSDKNWKNNIVNIDSPLQKVSQINGVEFDWIEDEPIHGNKGHDIGVIAQEIELILPEAVQTRENGMKAVKYEKLIPLLIEAIKDQQKQIEQLKHIVDGITR